MPLGHNHCHYRNGRFWVITSGVQVSLELLGREQPDATPLILAKTEGMGRRQDRREGRRDDRQDRRDDRQDCRGEEGVVGKDKRDCKQDERQERRDD